MILSAAFCISDGLQVCSIHMIVQCSVCIVQICALWRCAECAVATNDESGMIPEGGSNAPIALLCTNCTPPLSTEMNAVLKILREGSKTRTQSVLLMLIAIAIAINSDKLQCWLF